jgi:hypothetical protein
VLGDGVEDPLGVEPVESGGPCADDVGVGFADAGVVDGCGGEDGPGELLVGGHELLR